MLLRGSNGGSLGVVVTQVQINNVALCCFWLLLGRVTVNR